MSTTLVQLKKKLKRVRLTQDVIAREAKVDRTMVNHVLNGRAKSRPVMFVIERLLAECTGDGAVP